MPVGTTLDEAREILHQHKVEKLLVVDKDFRLKGLITVKDIQKAIKYPNACKDALGRLRCGAAIGVSRDSLERAHGAGRGRRGRAGRSTPRTATRRACIDMVRADPARVPEHRPRRRQRRHRRRRTTALIDAGVDAVKVGIGAGSICTTRVVAGIGVPMISVDHGVRAGGRARATCRSSPTAASATRATSSRRWPSAPAATMIGNLFAGTDESPGELILFQGRSYKEYRGMGSIGAMRRGSRDRYFQDEFDLEGGRAADKLVPEGIEGRVAHKGSAASVIHQLVGGLRAGMGYCGSGTIPELQRKAQLIRITPAGVRESHVHDVTITKEAPNYRME